MRLLFKALPKILILSLLLPLLPRTARSDSDAAVLILAQFGDRMWKNSVKHVVKAAKLPYPTLIFFGAADTIGGQQELQNMVEHLESNGANTIYVVPFTISTYSEVVRQWKYLLGIDVQPGYMNNPLFPITKRSTIRFLEPLNDSAVVVEILLDRTHEISASPEREHVIVVSRGARDHSDNDRWLKILKSISLRLKDRGGYKSVEAITLRDDAPAETRQNAVNYLRQRVKFAEQSGARALVVTLLLSPGGIEHRIGLELRGLTYAFNTKALLPDSRISEWIRSQIP